MTFAVIKTGGKQYLVKPGMKIRVEKLPGKEGETITFREVLLVGDEVTVEVGMPTVSKVAVEARVLRQERAPKIIIFKYKPKKRYRKKAGYRHHFSELEILTIKKAGAEAPVKTLQKESRSATRTTPRKIKAVKKS